ncbi:hypothetical protein BJX70DRAFT_410546 [Aspergillus crustosus]
MAPSLRNLIDFLLAEIALCGNQGASPADILSFIDVFYAKSTDADSNRNHVVDRRFQEKVWQWLARNPEVSIGEDRESNGLSLDDAEAHGGSPVRVFVSEERTWLAITGHEPDETKVLPMEFVLLSIIASRQAKGISQPELIKLSGQDKRSVPKRTDVLQRKGYIEKRAIQMKAARTSLCTLRKFLQPENNATVASIAESSEAPADAVKMIDFKSFTDKLFQILREYQIISRSDLKDLLGFNDRWRWKILSRALRKFERIGVLKRVRALSQYAETQKKYHPCVMLVREPSERDIEMFHDFSRNIYSNMEQGGDAEFDDDVEADDRGGEPSSTEKVHAPGREEDVEFSGRILPLWSPDRIIHNQLFDVVDRTGTTGCANSDVIRACFGVFWRRPLENTLARLVECWQFSQPPYLRHLALVRDTALQRTITHYIHYSARNFSKLVDTGEASWEAVEFVPRNNKSGHVRVPPVDAKPQLDVHGLPLDSPTNELVKHGDCSLLDCIWAVKPKDYTISSSDPKAIKLENGRYTVHYKYKKPPSGQADDTPATPSGVKAEGDEPFGVSADRIDTPNIKPSRKRKRESLNLSGMSEKEKLEALGFDETWTEYSVLLIDRPGPGVYVTSRGRRRPTGKQRGRPRNSRVAVFKSPKLLDLPWFEAEKGDSDDGTGAASQPPTQTANDSPPHTTARDSTEPGLTLWGTKQAPQRETSEAHHDSPKAAKRRRTSNIGEGLERARLDLAFIAGSPEESVTEKHAEELRKPVSGKRKRAISPESTQQAAVGVRKGGAKAANPQSQNGVEDHLEQNGKRRPTPKRPRKKAAVQEASKGAGVASPGEDITSRKGLSESAVITDQAEESLVTLTPQSADKSSNQTFDAPADHDAVPKIILAENDALLEGESSIVSANGVSSIQPSTPGTPVNGSTVPHISIYSEASASRVLRSKLADKGGSVSFLRRKIVMDLVEQAGGAFPMGPELWYPFVTAWLKSKYKEKPDMRTLKTAVKYLVDAGKLRQQTFCGKDNKGVMVTKTIICKADLAPDDAIIKNMQREWLKADGRHYFPPNVEVDPRLTKQGRARGVRYATDVPLESGLTVQLHQKPAAVLALEKRQGNSIQRRLLKKLDIETMRQSMQETRPSGVVRLLSTMRPDAFNEAMHGVDLENLGKTKQRRVITGNVGERLKRHHFPISLMGPYAMLMSPRQAYDPATGTFSTNAGLSARKIYTTHRHEPHLPYSVDDIFSQAGRRNTGMSGGADPGSKKFFQDTNAILRWELRNEGLLQQRTEDLRYITQTIPDAFESVPIEGDIRFDGGQKDKTPVSAVRTRKQIQEDRRPSFTFVHEEHPPFPEPPNFEEEYYLEEPEPNEPITIFNHPFVNMVIPQQTQQSPRPPIIEPPPTTENRRLEKLNELVATGNEPSSTSQNRQIARRNRTGATLSRSLYHRLLAAIVVVRTLAGGWEGKNVEWPLISQCFPDEDPKLIVDRGKGILARNRLQIAKMQSDFQDRFLSAYAQNEVPAINYDDLDAYDWKSVTDWANTQLDVPKSERIPDLPATRKQFDDVFKIREESLGSLDDFYQNQAPTQNRKRMLAASVPFATPLASTSNKQCLRDHSELSRFDTHKTWVRANVLTPAEVYRPADARAALAHIDRGELDSALQSLVTERVIAQSNKGRIVPGRNYDITDYFIQTLSKRRPIEIGEIRRASIFKTSVLDTALSEKGVYSVPYSAEDGDILAILNLLSHGKITTKPRDAPRARFGLTDGGYLTRLMDKDKLRFPVDIYPASDLYVPGNPIADKVSIVPPPCPSLIDISSTLSLPEKFPLWFDIHGGLIKVLWELAVAAVLGAVAVRPGITASGIAGMVRPCLGAWEVQMLLRWLSDVGAVRKTGQIMSGAGDADGNEHGRDEDSWCVLEWWWMALS